MFSTRNPTEILQLFFILLICVPLFTTLIYRFSGRRQIFKIDLVQFLYGFVLAPLAFIWAKTLVFVILRGELGATLSFNQYFFIDTLLSVLAVYLLAGIMIHSVMKTFWLEKQKVPAFDIFHLTEYFHLWWTHIVMFGGGVLVLLFFSLVNTIFPIIIEIPKSYLYMTLGVGYIFGIFWYIGIWNSDPKQERRSFLRLMKLFIGGLFLSQFGSFFIFDIPFSSEYIVYWCVAFASLGMLTSALFLPRINWIAKRQHHLLHQGWGNNIQIFADQKK